MKRQRWFIERRVGVRDYYPLGTQPAEGFSSPGMAHNWLLARGWIRRRLDAVTGEPFFEGMGGQRGFYLRAVPGEGPVPEPDPHGLYQWLTTRPRSAPRGLAANVRAALQLIRGRRDA